MRDILISYNFVTEGNKYRKRESSVFIFLKHNYPIWLKTLNTFHHRNKHTSTFCIVWLQYTMYTLILCIVLFNILYEYKMFFLIFYVVLVHVPLGYLYTCIVRWTFMSTHLADTDLLKYLLIIWCVPRRHTIHFVTKTSKCLCQ